MLLVCSVVSRQAIVCYYCALLSPLSSGAEVVELDVKSLCHFIFTNYLL